ncbi:rRNA maturation RNase YbeY [Telmatobacter bradus]|uniref:rRNA maturation RNase YbeY n=1 Tax=Telmatobacter bradus TaxID=474953 RepID=UPI003B4328AD
MIQIDPDLSSAPVASADGASKLSAQRIPAARTLDKFLAEAQEAVRLRGVVSVLLTNDKNIRRLNREFRHKNKATDVLSFPALDEGFGPVSERMAGDLAISIDTARQQAAAQGHALLVELKVLLLHGLLHLAGYDHEADEGQMARREQKLRSTLKLPLGLIERVEGTKPAAKKAATKSTAKTAKPAVKKAAAKKAVAKKSAVNATKKPAAKRKSR